eukprot:m.38399 g.38399  ORF g.38399 m.38399 type:complete len:361 (+) comp9431_c0_seq2:76-1158(+)
MVSLGSPLVKLLGIKYPVLLAGMANVSNAELAAAVSNAGGLGVVGGAFLVPKDLRRIIKELKSLLVHKDSSFGVDLLLPQVGGSARATNYDYTHGTLPELIDIIIEEKAKLFVCAVGTPPKWVVEKLHSAGILVMNMVGSARHVPKALEAGVDIICAQGSEAGGHTGVKGKCTISLELNSIGEVATSVLVPQCVDLCKGHVSQFHNGPVYVVAAGGIYDGRGLAASLCWGAVGVWVGTRFVATFEAGASDKHKHSVLESSSEDTMRSSIFTGRPARVRKSNYVLDWEINRKDEQRKLLSQGKLPIVEDMNKNKDFNFGANFPHAFGQAAGAISDLKHAKDVIIEMTRDAECILRTHAARL